MWILRSSGYRKKKNGGKEENFLLRKIKKLNRKKYKNQQPSTSNAEQQVDRNELNNIENKHIFVRDYDSTSEGDDQGIHPKNIP